jgi:AcrR family transcriptional regulator
LKSTRDRILDAAAHLMRTQGLASATTKEIARGADLSEAALYRHFRDQSEIFLCVMAERMPAFITAMKDLPARVGRGHVGRTLEGIALGALAFYGEVAPMGASLFSEPELLARHREALRRERAGPHLALEKLSTYLRAEQNLGRLPKLLDADAVAALLLGACFQRAFIQRFSGVQPSAHEEKRFVRRLIRTLLPQRAAASDS